MFETKDSGKHEDYASGMRRDTQDGKAAFHLIVMEGIPYEEQMLTRFAMLMERGRLKYGERNHEKSDSKEEMDRFKASAFRHLMQWFCGVDDGEDHGSAILFNVVAYESAKTRRKK